MQSHKAGSTTSSTSSQSQHRNNKSKSAMKKSMKVHDDNAASVQAPELPIPKLGTRTPAIGAPLPRSVSALKKKLRWASA